MKANSKNISTLFYPTLLYILVARKQIGNKQKMNNFVLSHWIMQISALKAICYQMKKEQFFVKKKIK